MEIISLIKPRGGFELGINFGQKKLTKKFFFVFFILSCLSWLSLWPAANFVLAGDWSVGPDKPAPLTDLEAVFGRILDVVLVLAGIAVMVMLIVGGFQYLTSGDNPKATEKASKTLTYAIAGVVVIIAAWFILQAIQVITGLNVTIFRMPR